MAQRLRAQREARLGYSPTDTSALSYYLSDEPSVSKPPTLGEVARAARVTERVPPSKREVAFSQENDGRSARNNNEPEWYERAGATALDTVANVGLGAADVLEGVYDIGAGLVGEIGGWFSEDFKKAVEEHVEYDAIGSIEKTLDELGLEHSYLNEEGVGEFVAAWHVASAGFCPRLRSRRLRRISRAAR